MGAIHFFLLLVLFFAPKSWGLLIPKGFDHTHQLWGEVLQQHTSREGNQILFSYAALKKEPGKFQNYLQMLEGLDPKDYEAFSREEKMSFLINAYNAYTVKLILDHYPLKSIKDIGSWITSAWKKKFFTLLGEKRHLDWIEHDQLRGIFKDSRIHFAVNCASVSCPNLQIKPFVAKALDLQLTLAAKEFLADAEKNSYDREKKIAYVSSLFDWYGKDFASDQLGLLSSLSQWGAEDLKNADWKDWTIQYKEYDWNLNQSLP